MNFALSIASRSRREWLSSLPVLLLLLITISAETFEYTHAQLLKLGEQFWQDYYTLRIDPPAPSCQLTIDIDQEVERLRKAWLAEADEDGLDALFAPEPFNEVATRSSLEKRAVVCQAEHTRAADSRQRVTDEVRVFRYVEKSVALFALAIADHQRTLLLLLLFVAAITSTVTQHHIAFRPVRTKVDHSVSTSIQAVGNVVLAYSALAYRSSMAESGIPIAHPEVSRIMIVGFLLLFLVNVLQLLKPPRPFESGGHFGQAVLTIPLYTYMAMIAGNYFILTEGHGSGVVIYIGQLMEQAKLFLKIGLYIWIGMLLKQTRLGERVFNVFKPWQLPPEVLAVVAILVMAVPTAYTGASGIIIIAMGVVVYEELRKAGARRQLALAATAMCGSAGVVLRPCLLVVLIAALNKEVVTDQLYSWGVKVFMLSMLIFFAVVMLVKKLTKDQTQKEAMQENMQEDMQKEERRGVSFREAWRPSLSALIALLPYVLIFSVVAGLYAIFLDAYLDEFSAPIILPIIVVCIIAYEKLKDRSRMKALGQIQKTEKPIGFEAALRTATTESTVHIGALIMLMGLSFATGGVIERSGFFEGLPEVFANVWLAMSLLVLVLIAIGMIMDPFGAVVLVTGTIASVAYANGIHPVHFWMVTLVAFELGYLSPPVALNHLLTRQVVGEEEARLASQEGDTFWYRHEKIVLPLSVMGATLILVAYIPILFY